VTSSVFGRMSRTESMAITEVDEKLLVKAYQAGDDRAFDAIVRTQWKALYAHAARRLSDPDAAEDAVQDTLLRAYRALPNLDGDLALRAWLHRILTNVCYDEGNRRRRAANVFERVVALPEETAPDPADEAVLHDTVRVMSAALEDLPESYREALVLRYVDGLSFREVAEAAGITEENARARVHRGRLVLHRVLSRVTVVLAVLIPGLRRTHTGVPAEPAAAAGGADHGIHLVTQLTAHAANAAPTVSRLAEVASATSGAKSAFVTTAVAAVAAVAVPVTAYTVHDARQVERPAAIAAPSEVEATPLAPRGAAGAASVAGASEPGVGVVGGSTSTSSTTTSSTTSTSVPTTTTTPPSAAQPFQSPDTTAHSTEPPPVTPTESTPPEEPAEEQPAETITGSLTSSQLQVSGEGPNLDVSGPGRVGDRDVAISGRLTLHDDGPMSGELTVTVDGVAYPLRLRGAIVERTDGGDIRFRGKFSLPGGAELSLPESGDVIEGSFRRADGPASSLLLDLQGPPADDPA
jgi:RNA polymerase sigma-70 factor (ECF subfamily)